MGNFLCKEDHDRFESSKASDTSNCSTSRRASSVHLHPQQNFFVFDQLCLDSRFENGNLLHAEQIDASHYNLWIAPDCYKTPEETKHNIWFHFKLLNINFGEELPTLQFTIKNMSKLLQPAFNNGMVPVYSSPSTNHTWNYLPSPIVETKQVKSLLEVTFEYKILPEDTQDAIFFAFSFPYTYTRCQELLSDLEGTYHNDQDIYFRKELLVHSFEGRNIDLLTITAHDHRITSNQANQEFEPKPEGLFPAPTSFQILEHLENQRKEIKRPFIFRKKKYVLITCRTRSCESPSSFVLEGFLASLLNKSDYISRKLLQDFVFVIIPMLNPDGVAKGYSRTDVRGNDLDRVYSTSSENSKPHPSISAVSDLAKTLSDGRLVLYLDLHTQSTKNSAFLTGNFPDDLSVRTENILFAVLCDIYSRVFDLKFCSFEKSGRYEKRKAVDRKTDVARISGIQHCYKFGTGYFKMTKDPKRYNREQNVEKDLAREVEGVLNVPVFEEAGRDMRHVLLEMFAEHPMSLIPKTWYGSVQNLRDIIYEAVSERQEQQQQDSNEESKFQDFLKPETLQGLGGQIIEKESC